MKIQILLVVTAFVYCQCAPTEAPTEAPSTKSVDQLKEDLLRFAGNINEHIEREVRKLEEHHREHLAMGLEAARNDLNLLAYELKTTQPGPEALKLIETELFIIEERIVEEVKFIEHLSDETAKTEDQLIAITLALRKMIAREVEALKTYQGKEKERAEKVSEFLRIQDMQLAEIISDLFHSKTKHDLLRTEVELRKIDRRIFDELRHFHREFPPATTAASV